MSTNNDKPRTYNKPQPQNKEQTHRLNILLPVSLHQQMRIEAAETGVTMTDQIIHAWKEVRGLND